MTSSKWGPGGGVSQMMIFDDIGGVGVPKVPKMDDVIYEQSLINITLIISLYFIEILLHIVYW